MELTERQVTEAGQRSLLWSDAVASDHTGAESVMYYADYFINGGLNRRWSFVTMALLERQCWDNISSDAAEKVLYYHQKRDR